MGRQNVRFMLMSIRRRIQPDPPFFIRRLRRFCSEKHFAFTRCGELNLYGMVDAQIAVLDDKLMS